MLLPRFEESLCCQRSKKSSDDLKAFGQSASEKRNLPSVRKNALLPHPVLDGLFPCETPVWRCITAADGQAPYGMKTCVISKLLMRLGMQSLLYLDPYSRPAEKRGGRWIIA